MCVYSVVPLAHALAIISRVNSLLSGTGAVYAATRMQITLHGFYHIANTHTHSLSLAVVWSNLIGSSVAVSSIGEWEKARGAV